MCWPVSLALAQTPQSASSLIFDATEALRDGMSEMAVSIARGVYIMPEISQDERSAALDIWLSALRRQGDHETLLKQVDRLAKGSDTEAIAQQLSVWRARALLGLGRADDAAAILGKKPDGLPLKTEVAWVTLLPEARLAAGFTNSALVAYERVRAIPVKEPLPEIDQARYDEARLLTAQGRSDQAIELLSAWLTTTSSRSPGADGARLLLAQELLRTPNPQPAAVILRPLLNSTNTPPDIRATALTSLARLARSNNDTRLAIEHSEQALNAASGDTIKFAAHSLLVRLLIEDGQTERAIKELREAVRTPASPSETANLRLDVAQSLFIRGKLEESAAEAMAILHTQTSASVETRAHSISGEVLAAQGRFEEASVALARAFELSGNDDLRSGYLFRMAEFQRSADMHAKAVETLATFQKLYPGSARAVEAAILQGESLMATDPQQAREFLAALDTRFPRTPQGARGLFLAARLEAASNSDAAISLYSKVIEHSAATPELRSAARVGRGLLQFQGYHLEDALVDFEEGSKGDGDTFGQAAYMQLATLYNLGREQLALESANNFLTQHPDSAWAPDVVFWVAHYHFNRAEYNEAIGFFDNFIQQWPTRPESDAALLWKARSQFALRNYAEASATCLKLIAEHPKSELAPEARFVHGESLCELMRFGEAILVFDELLVLHPESPWNARALGRKGDALFTLSTDTPQRYNESIAAYRALIARHDLPLDMQLQGAYKIGRCHEKLGQLEQAKERYYRGVVLRFAEAREQGMWLNDRAKAWFARAALSAADLYEKEKRWPEAAAILRRLAKEDIQGRAEAAARMRRIEKEHPGASIEVTP